MRLAYDIIFSIAAILCALVLALGVPTIIVYCAASNYLDSLIASIQKHTTLIFNVPMLIVRASICAMARLFPTKILCFVMTSRARRFRTHYSHIAPTKEASSHSYFSHPSA